MKLLSCNFRVNFAFGFADTEVYGLIAPYFLFRFNF